MQSAGSLGCIKQGSCILSALDPVIDLVEEFRPANQLSIVRGALDKCIQLVNTKNKKNKQQHHRRCESKRRKEKETAIAKFL